mgnify:CR=1 FL=1
MNVQFTLPRQFGHFPPVTERRSDRIGKSTTKSSLLVKGNCFFVKTSIVTSFRPLACFSPLDSSRSSCSTVRRLLAFRRDLEVCFPETTGYSLTLDSISSSGASLGNLSTGVPHLRIQLSLLWSYSSLPSWELPSSSTTTFLKGNRKSAMKYPYMACGLTNSPWSFAYSKNLFSEGVALFCSSLRKSFRGLQIPKESQLSLVSSATRYLLLKRFRLTVETEFPYP